MNLRACLQPCAKKSERAFSVGDDSLNRSPRELPTKAKVPWKKNVLRHSYVSYRVAETNDVNRTSLETGNSPAKIFSNYRELVTPAEAKKWFAILPLTKKTGRKSVLQVFFSD